MLLVASVASLVALGIEIYVYTIAYPSFALVGDAEFRAIHTLHTSRITYSIGPALLIAFFANLTLAIERPRAYPTWLPIAATCAGAAILAITILIQVPLHTRLTEAKDAAAITQLNANEWPRALATLAQAACNITMLALTLRR